MPTLGGQHTLTLSRDIKFYSALATSAPTHTLISPKESSRDSAWRDDEILGIKSIRRRTLRDANLTCDAFRFTASVLCLFSSSILHVGWYITFTRVCARLNLEQPFRQGGLSALVYIFSRWHFLFGSPLCV